MQLDIKEAARLFNISEREMLRWIEQKGAPALSAQGNFMFNRAELTDWARRHGIPMERPISELLEEEPLPTIGEALAAGGITRLDAAAAANKEQAIHSMIQAMTLPPHTDREALFKVIIAREKQSSTGIGEGIAIPHVRNPLILNTEAPLINLCLLENAVEFGALDGKPVYALFTMISPNARLHLHLISRLALVLHDVQLKELLNAKAKDELLLGAIARIEEALTAKRK